MAEHSVKPPNLLLQALMDLWQGPQNLIGLGAGFAQTGQRPTQSMDPQGNREFRFNVPNSEPRAIGSSIIGPENPDPESLAHERVHTRQSRELGPSMLASRLLGDQMSKFDTGDSYFGHPMEHEAYLETASTPNLAQYLQDVRSMRAMKSKR